MDFSSFDFTTVSGYLTSILTGVTGWLAGRKKRKRSDQQIQIDILNQSFEAYKNIINDLRGEVKILLKKNAELELKIDELAKSEDRQAEQVQELRHAIRNFVQGSIGIPELKKVLDRQSIKDGAKRSTPAD